MMNTYIGNSANTASKKVDPAFAWIREEFIDYALGKINPTFALKRILATVINIKSIGDGMVALTLQPNNKFTGFHPGQYVMLTVKVAGSYQQRCYSIVSGNKNKLVLGIKSQGKVSTFVAEQLQPGTVVEISPAQGEFVVENFTKPMLFIASGSGITPVIAMVTHALNNSPRPITLIYYARDHVFKSELEQLCNTHAHFKLVLVNTLLAHEHFNAEKLATYCADIEQRNTYVCGAPALMQDVAAFWQSKKLGHLLHMEHFVAPPALDGGAVSVTFRRSINTFNATGSILVAAEKAGLKPAYGCRQGVCNTCICKKLSGSVRNQLTGDINHEPNTQIKLCISEAISPVEIDL